MVAKPIVKTSLGALAALLIVALVYGLWLAAHPTPPPFQGQAEARVVNVAAKIPGRILRVNVREGDTVKAGDVLVEIDIPELNAKLAQVKAQRDAAKAKSRLVDEGARDEQIRGAKAQYERAKALASLAKRSYARVDSLFKEGLISTQKHDEARASRDNAINAELAAKSQYDMALSGSRNDEKAAAAALAEQAEKGVAEVMSLASEAKVIAPRAGEVSRIVLEAGELTAAGFPLVTLVDRSDQWAVFNIREDELPGIEVGTIMKADIPAIGKKGVAFKVYFINPRADYATWRSTRQSRGYDMRTFEVRAKPVDALPALRPGMSVIVQR